jgi:hypothetical protein
MSKRSGEHPPAQSLPPGKRFSRSTSPAAAERCDSTTEFDLNTHRTTLYQRLQPTADTLTHGHREILRVTNHPTRGIPANNTHSPDSRPTPKCFRIANVPSDWSTAQLVHALRTIDSFLEQNLELSLYPACCGPTQTALLNLSTCTRYFQDLKPNEFNYVKTLEGILLVIDSHFYNLTPLNTPEGYIIAE